MAEGDEATAATIDENAAPSADAGATDDEAGVESGTDGGGRRGGNAKRPQKRMQTASTDAEATDGEAGVDPDSVAETGEASAASACRGCSR